MDKPIRVPRNQTALMQLLQRQVSSGHYYWCADTIPNHKLAGFIDKWSGYALRSDSPARAYRKQTKRASVHLCLNPAQSVSKRVNKSLPPTRISANQIMIGEMAA
jgi:hypothetical protein